MTTDLLLNARAAAREDQRPAGAPLSLAQAALWTLQTLHPESHAYNEVSALALAGALDVAALERSVNEIVRRHEVLRTTFPVHEGTPRQLVGPAPFVPLVLVNLTTGAGEEQQAEVARLAESASCHAFDLVAGPLLHVSLLKLAPERHILLVAAHHIVLDGWSARLFLTELGQLYAAFREGQASPLPELPMQYADFAAWEAAQVTEDSFAAEVAYWVDTLRDLPPPLVLPVAQPAAPGDASRGVRRFFEFDTHAARRLRDLAKRERATPFMVLLAVFQTLLFRYTRQTDVIVGGPLANRTRPELEHLIGFFVNSLVFRGDLSGEPTFRQLLRRTKAVTLAAFDHQVPFGRIVDALQPDRDAGRQTLFQLAFSYQSTPVAPLRTAGLSITPLPVEVLHVKYDLLLSLGTGAHGMAGFWEYDTRLFAADVIDRMTGHLRTLLEAALDDPDQPIGLLPMLAPAERQQVLHDWHGIETPVADDACIHTLFEEQARRTPEAPAVTCADRALSYRELDLQANRLARRLLDLGVGPDVLVGLCAPRSIEMVIGLLAVLKAGGAYVPLDPRYPLERLARMLDDAAAPIILYHSAAEHALPATSATHVRLDEESEASTDEASPHASASVESGVAPDHLAYVMYTSGSNGHPKGVMVTHRNVVHSTAARQQFYRDEPIGSFLLLSSLSFDSSVAGLFWTLTSGGQLVIPAESDGFDVREAYRLIQRHRVSHLLCIPSVYDTLLREAQPYHLEGLRTVIVAGEPCRLALVERHYLLRQSTRLVNEYGPTEATVWCCAYDCRPGETRSRIPIGRPIANTHVFVRDEQLQPVPIGVPGEICVSGRGLARGYLGLPDLTASRFVADPLGAWPHETLYRTGDLGQYLPDGNIELLGRLDDQVKIRGCRLELGDVAAALESHRGIREAAALVSDTTSEDSQLIAVIVEAGGPVSDEVLRPFLRERLPAFAVPTEIVRVDRLPRLPNGKLDRRALAAAGTHAQHTGAVPANREWTPLERHIADIWKSVLGKDPLTVDDNFFQIGGDSLSVIRVHNRLRTVMDRDVAITDLFKAPTVASLAALVGAAGTLGEV